MNFNKFKFIISHNKGSIKDMFNEFIDIDYSEDWIDKFFEDSEYSGQVYKDGSFKDVIAKDAIEVIKKFDLCNKANISTRLRELEGEQKAIVFSNNEIN